MASHKIQKMYWTSCSTNELKNMGCVWVKAEYFVDKTNFETKKAYVLKRDIYTKPNGRTIFLIHRYGKWINFNKYLVKRTSTPLHTHHGSIGGGYYTTKHYKKEFLDSATRQKIVADYIRIYGE